MVKAYAEVFREAYLSKGYPDYIGLKRSNQSTHRGTQTVGTFAAAG
jgi:hypothetical protein